MKRVKEGRKEGRKGTFLIKGWDKQEMWKEFEPPRKLPKQDLWRGVWGDARPHSPEVGLNLETRAEFRLYLLVTVKLSKSVWVLVWKTETSVGPMESN